MSGKKRAVSVKNLAQTFKESVASYLKAVRPQYDRQQGRFQIREREVQAYFFSELIGEKIPARLEGRYTGSTGEFYDVLIEQTPKIFIEIEWNANLTDGFGTQTFRDLEKLCRITKTGNIALFLAVNISNKYREFPKKPVEITEIARLPVSRPGLGTALIRYCNKQAGKQAPILTMSPRLWYWRYPYSTQDFNVTVLTCHGRKTQAGWR